MNCFGLQNVNDACSFGLKRPTLRFIGVLEMHYMAFLKAENCQIVIWTVLLDRYRSTDSI